MTTPLPQEHLSFLQGEKGIRDSPRFQDEVGICLQLGLVAFTALQTLSNQPQFA